MFPQISRLLCSLSLRLFSKPFPALLPDSSGLGGSDSHHFLPSSAALATMSSNLDTLHKQPQGVHGEKEDRRNYGAFQDQLYRGRSLDG